MTATPEEKALSSMREYGESRRRAGLAQGLVVAQIIADKMTIRVPGKKAQELVDYAYQMALAELEKGRKL